MSSRKKIPTSARNIVMVPLATLKKSPKNVRKMPHTLAELDALAASIASLGMLQFPVVEPELGPKDKPTGNYLVNAGEGRRLAQLLRAKRKEIKKDEPIARILDAEHNATEISLAENAIRSNMHPADEYEGVVPGSGLARCSEPLDKLRDTQKRYPWNTAGHRFC